MTVAIVLITIERAKVDEVAQHLLEEDGVAEVYSVAGQWDLVAVLRTSTNEEIADVMTGHIRKIPYIIRTETLMAFKTYSKKDMGAMFSIGNEEPK